MRGVSGEVLAVALREAFVIASGRMVATRAVLVRVELDDGSVGWGEAACLPPVTREDMADVMAAVERAGDALAGHALDTGRLGELLPDSPVARSGIECAMLDALARSGAVPLHELLAKSSRPAVMRTDITIPIAPAERMAELAREHASRGFDCFKVKVGKDAKHDRDALVAMHGAVPGARFRLDANEGYTARDALALLDDLLGDGLAVELFEQPCRRGDHAGMIEVTARSAVPVVADESIRSLDDLDRIARDREAHGVNLKLAKMGGPLAALAIGRRARALGMPVMAGAMVETRLGLTAMAHVVTALGGVDFVDLDTAFLLADDPFEGGYEARGPDLTLVAGTGLALNTKPLG